LAPLGQVFVPDTFTTELFRAVLAREVKESITHQQAQNSLKARSPPQKFLVRDEALLVLQERDRPVFPSTLASLLRARTKRTPNDCA